MIGARALVSGTGVLIAVATGACRSTPRPPGPMASALIATTAELGAPQTSIMSAWTQIDRIAALVEQRNRRSGGPLIDDLSAVVFDDQRLVREIDDNDPRFFLFPSVLSERRGSCLGLGAVFLMVAERIGLKLDGVRVPGHFFVRTRDPAPRNIELLRRGETMPDDWYRQKYGPWPSDDGAYLRPLPIEGVTALFWFNAGNFARRNNDLERARLAYSRAAHEAPDFAEAQASLGLAWQLAGALPEAAHAYREAAQARPGLPGLARNVELLESERRSIAHGESHHASTEP